MKEEFKVSVAQFGPAIGELERNLALHLEYIEKARAEGASLIVFPELSLTGYTLMDLSVEVAISPQSELLKPLLGSSEKISICLGAVEISPEHFIYNSSFFLENGEIVNIQRKIYPPTYGVFDEKRYFQQGRRIRAFNSKLGRFGVLICNDARHPGLAHILAVDGAQFIIVQSAIPARGHPTGDKPAPARYFETGHRHYASTYGVYVIFSNLAGYEEGLLFCGNSMVMAPGGAVLKEAPLFEEAMITASLSQEEIKRFRMTSPLLGEENIDILMDELKRIKKQRIQGQ